MWADENALHTIAEAAHVIILLIDEQAARPSSRAKRSIVPDAVRPDGRFLAVGAAPDRAHCVVLHRSRRQHYNAVVIDGKALICIRDLPRATKALWPALANKPSVQALGVFRTAAEEVHKPASSKYGSKRKRSFS